MRAGRRVQAAVCGLLAVTVTGLVVVGAGDGASFSDGNAAAARTGCGPETGCHGVPGQASPGVGLTADGFPDAYTPLFAYDITIAVTGGPPVLPASANQGGFAVEASAGSFLAPDDRTQVVENRSATHTGTGNDQRSWSLVWQAPEAGAGEVTVWVSVNAVNGNGAPDPADLWTVAQLTIPEAAEGGEGDGGTGNGMAPENPPQGDGADQPGGGPIPGAGTALVAFAAGLGALGAAARRHQRREP